MRREEQSRDTFTSLQLRAHGHTHTKGSITGLQSQAAVPHLFLIKVLCVVPCWQWGVGVK